MEERNSVFILLFFCRMSCGGIMFGKDKYTTIHLQHLARSWYYVEGVFSSGSAINFDSLWCGKYGVSHAENQFFQWIYLCPKCDYELMAYRIKSLIKLRGTLY